jgi:GNAT superfamily N-acetyltransferase
VSPGPTAHRPAFAELLTPATAAVLAELRAHAFEHMATARGGAIYLDRHAVATPDASDAAHRVWLGGLEGTALGYLIATVVVAPSGDHVGVVEAIYVEPSARGCGIGECLMDTAIAWFTEQGCVGVESTALPGERDTKNFFEENGLKTRLLTVYRPLP